LDLDARTLQRWRDQCIGTARRAGPFRRPKNKLSPRGEERTSWKRESDCNSESLSTKQIVPILAERGD